MRDLHRPAVDGRRDRRQFLGLMSAAAGAIVVGCEGGGGGPTRPTLVHVDSRLLGALDREPVADGAVVHYTDANGTAATTDVDVGGRFVLEALFGSFLRVTAEGYGTRAATPVDRVGPELFLVPLRDRALAERVRQVFLAYSSGLIRLPSLNLTAGERSRTMRVWFSPDLPQAYRDVVLEYMDRASEFTAGGLDLASVAAEEHPILDTPEDGLFKFRVDTALAEDAVTLVKSNTSVISGSSTTFRPGLSGARLRQVAGQEILTAWGAIGASPNGGLMAQGAPPEDPRDVAMATIAYRLEPGYVWG